MKNLFIVSIVSFIVFGFGFSCKKAPEGSSPVEVKPEKQQQAAGDVANAQQAHFQGVPAPSDVAAPPPDAQKTTTGLASKVLANGKGITHPVPTSVVKVHYTGWTTDGKMFDSSVVRGEPASFPLNRVIQGWTEGLQLMVEGEKRRLWIPESLAYQGRPGAPQGMLVFDVELIQVQN